MATSLKVASIAYLCDQHHETVTKLADVLSNMTDACFDASKTLNNVTSSDELREIISHISTAEETTVCSAAYSMLRCMQTMSKELKTIAQGLEGISSTIKVSQEISGQELEQIRKLDDSVLEKVVKQKELKGQKITALEAKKAMRETIGSVRCWMTGIRQHELGRLHMLRSAFDTGAKIWFGSSARMMKDAKRLFKASNDVEPELDVDLSLHWAGANVGKAMSPENEADEEMSKEVVQDDPLFQWFVESGDKDNIPEASPSSSCYYDIPEEDGRPVQEISDEHSQTVIRSSSSSSIQPAEKSASSTKKNSILETFFIGSPESSNRGQPLPEENSVTIPPPPPLPSASQVQNKPASSSSTQPPRVINLRTRTRPSLSSPPAVGGTGTFSSGSSASGSQYKDCIEHEKKRVRFAHQKV